jgi:hypothetical protein|tara:strand:+ start:2304 stop:3203 length:900 start_codon:yes stop_codon:yes gene_type:complete
MPTVSGTLKTFDQVGKREDVEDIIYDISPTTTPMLSSIGSSTAAATLHQWLQDELAAVATNASVEGADAGAGSTITQTVKTANTQIFDKVVQVSGTAEAVGTYGRTSDLAYAIAKAGKEIKRDIEHSFVGAGQAGTAGNGTTARQLTSAANQIAAATTNTAGSNRAFTEALLLDVLQKCFEEGGEPNQVQVTPSHSVTVAGFATASGRQRDFATGTTLVNAVDIIISPFGQVSVVPNRFLNANTVLVLDTEYWSRAVLRPMQTIVLAKTGDSDKRQMLTELTLVCENDKASGKIDALTA